MRTTMWIHFCTRGHLLENDAYIGDITITGEGLYNKGTCSTQQI